jgi:hypothetical protein
LQYLLTSPLCGQTLVPFQTHQIVVLLQIQKRQKNRFQNLSNLMMIYSIASSIEWVIVKVFGKDEYRVVYLQTNPQTNHNNQRRSRIYFLRNALFDEEGRCETTCFSLSSNACIALGWIYCVGDFGIVKKWHVIKKAKPNLKHLS